MAIYRGRIEKTRDFDHFDAGLAGAANDVGSPLPPGKATTKSDKPGKQSKAGQKAA